ncbi:MAG: FtsQ-type POTRA domain-containing protein [Armatimonadota bacterium]|nr:MAG: FtsQ-type POTRA domain-containing protein [Armatimonadota bacterium]
MHLSLIRRTLVFALVVCPALLAGVCAAAEVGEAGSQAVSSEEGSAAMPEPTEEPPSEVTPPAEAGPPLLMPSAAEAGDVDKEEDAAVEMIPPPIANIEVKGNQQIPTEDILRVIVSEVGGTFSEDQVDQDREAVRSLGWFQRVAVEQEIGEGGVHLVFRVEENPVVDDVQFEGIRALTREELLGAMKTQPGQVYSTPLLLQDKDAIQKLYESKRYDLAMVVGQRMLGGVLTLSIAEGEIEAIEIEGNTRTKEYVIRRYVRTKPGEVYNGRKLSRDVTRLMNLGYFETVRYEADVGDEPGKVVVVITVVEKRLTGNAGFGLMYASVQGVVGFVDLVKTNVGGTGQVVSLRGEFGGRTSYELGYQHPWVMTPETRLNLNLYNSFILREAFVTLDTGERRSILYDERRAGGNLTLGRPVSDHTTLFLRLRSDAVSISGLREDEEAFLAGAAFAPRDVRSVTLAAATDTRDSHYNPRRGSYSQLSMEFAGVFGGVNFNKYVSDTRRYFPVGANNALAMRLLGGVVSGDAPYLEQFLIGGSESLRGYRTDRFVGTRMALLNTEYRFRLSDNLLGVAFVDVGDAWGGPVAADPAFEDIVHDAFEPNVGYGLGVRVRTPIGPLRLDLGFSEEGTETHFGVRHMF